MRLIIAIILIGLLLNHMIYLASAESINIGMPDRFQKDDNNYVCDSGCTYKKLAFRIVFNESYNITKVGIFRYFGHGEGVYSVKLVTDNNSNPDMANVLISNPSFTPNDYAIDLSRELTLSEIPIPSYIVQPNTPFWFVFESSAGGTDFGLAGPPQVNFDWNYTMRHWTGTQWAVPKCFGYDCGGVIWVVTDSGEPYGQLKIRRDRTAGVCGANLMGQTVNMPSSESYTLDNFSLYIWRTNGAQDGLYVTAQSLDNNSILWTRSIGDALTINNNIYDIGASGGLYAYTFSEPKPVISNTSRIRYYVSSPGSTSGCYDLNSINFRDEYHSWGALDENSIRSSNNGASWYVYPLMDFQGSFTAHLTTSQTNPYYVSTTGNNANDGKTPATAWRTMAYAAQQAKAGDTVYVTAGNYGNDNAVFSNSGNATHWITFTAYNGPVTMAGDRTKNGFDTNYKSYIRIEGDFNIDNYNTGVVYNGNYIDVMGVKITNTADDGMSGRGDASYITIDGVTVRNAPQHGILSFGYPYTSAYRHHITVRNSIIDNANHNGIDIHTNNHDVLLENNRITNVTNSYGVFIHNFNETNIIIRNNTFIHNTRGIGLNGAKDIIIENNYFDDSYSSRAIDLDMEPVYDWALPGIHNVTIRNNIMRNSASYDILITNENMPGPIDTVSDIQLVNNSLTKPIYFAGVTSYTERITIKDIPDTTNSIKFGGGILDSSVEFTDGKVFTENFPTAPYWYPDRSTVSIAGITGSTTITTYPMTAKPASGSATVTVNMFDTTLSSGTLVDFNADTTNGNAVTFTVSTLKPNTEYIVKKGGTTFATPYSDSSGKVTFANSIWPSAAFTIEEGINNTVPAPAGFAAYWRFDGDASDSSGNNNHGTIYGATPTIGKIGNALQFDGTDDYVQIQDASLNGSFPGKSTGGATNFTITARIKLDTTGDRRPIASKQGDGTNPDRGFLFTLESGVLNFEMWKSDSSSTSVTSAQALTAGSWYHVAATYEYISDGSSNIRMYTNGVNSGFSNTAVGPLQGNSRPFDIGMYYWSSSYSKYMDGVVDEVKVYNRALTAQEILAEYDAANRAYVNVMQYFYPDSSIIYESAIDGKVPASISALPASGNVSVLANVFTNSLVNFSADASAGNNVAFSIESLKPNANYSIKKDGIVIDTMQANASGKITFNNSVW